MCKTYQVLGPSLGDQAQHLSVEKAEEEGDKHTLQRVIRVI